MVKPTGPVPASEGPPPPPAIARPPLRVPLSKALTMQLQAFRRRNRDGYKPAPTEAAPVAMPEDLPDETLEQAKDRLARFDQAVVAAKKRLDAAEEKLGQSEAKLVATRSEIATVQRERSVLGQKIATVQRQIADIDSRGAQLAERKADLLIRIADHEAKLDTATDAQFQKAASDLRVLKQELKTVRAEQGELREQRRTLLVSLGQSISTFVAGTMATIESAAKAVGAWLWRHLGPLRRPLENLANWGPVKTGLEFAGKVWSGVRGYFARHSEAGAAGAPSEREKQVLERLGEAVAGAVAARKEALAAGRTREVDEDREIARIAIQEAALASEKAPLVQALAGLLAEDRKLEAKSQELLAREREEQRQVEIDRQARDQAQRQYEEAQSRKRAEEKRYWELYDQRKRDEQRYAEQSAEKKREAARLDGKRQEAQRLETLADEVRRLTVNAAQAGAPDAAIGTTSTGKPVAPIDEGTVARAREQKARIKEATRIREDAAPRVARQLDAVANLAEDKVASLAPGQEKFSVADAATVARRRYRRDLLES